MKTLYLECSMGAAGDMLMAALLELHPNKKEFLQRLNGLGIPGVSIEQQQVMRCGISGSHIIVRIDGMEENSRDLLGEQSNLSCQSHMHGHKEEHSHEEDRKKGQNHSHEHYHSTMADIRHLISHLALPAQVKKDAVQVYELIAEAESKVHQREVEQIHFHEVGTMDAVADIVGVSLLIYALAPEQIVASPLRVGSGHVSCAHGILPVPAPATAWLLRGVPIYGGEIQGELCTPTGAALLKHFVTEFSSMPQMNVEKIGYGMGKKEFEMANCLRTFWGECHQKINSVSELCCNLDDMTPEEVGFATETLIQQGALDVYTTGVQMKKNRPGIILTCLCRECDKEKFIRLLFRYTTTLGIREYRCQRYELHRRIEETDTEFGKVHKKISEGYGIQREKFEYEDLAQLARTLDLSLRQVQEKIF